jgi:hypothetical protein
MGCDEGGPVSHRIVNFDREAVPVGTPKMPGEPKRVQPSEDTDRKK